MTTTSERYEYADPAGHPYSIECTYPYTAKFKVVVCKDCGALVHADQTAKHNGQHEISDAEPDCDCGHPADDHVFTGGAFCNICECGRYVLPPVEPERCVICAASAPRHGGLCCSHRYDEQPPCDRRPTPPAEGDQ